jgi:hypothetical protein
MDGHLDMRRVRSSHISRSESHKREAGEVEYSESGFV